MKYCLLFLLLSLSVTADPLNQQRDNTSPVAAVPPQPITRYRVIFNQPADGETINHHQGNVFLVVALDPMPPHYQLELWLDGRAAARVSNHTSLTLENLTEKHYRAIFRLLDKNGRFLASSKPITFYLHRVEPDQSSQHAP